MTKFFAETYDNWPDVLAMCGGRDLAADPVGGGSRRRNGSSKGRSGEQWSGRLFFQSGAAMQRCRQQLRMTNRSSTRLTREIDIGSVPIAKREWTPADMVARGTDGVIFQLSAHHRRRPLRAPHWNDL